MEENQNLEKDIATEVETAETTEAAEVVEETEAAGETEVVEETVVEEETPEALAEKKLAEAEAKAADYLDKWQRLMAEFDNYRKRSEKEKADSYDFAVCNTVLELLPIIDNFERALKVESSDKALSAGVEMIYKQLMGMLEKLHVSPIDATGKAFDPKFHNAIQHIDDENLGENVVATELQKGYLYKEEKVIRHSLVQVAN